MIHNHQGPTTHETPNTTVWYAWAGLALCSFAILEHRALRHEQERATLSYVVRKHVRRNDLIRHGAAVGFMGFTAWWVHHVCYQKLDDKRSTISLLFSP